MSKFAYQLKGVSRTYQHFNLKDITLSLKTGCIMGLIGPNGAGKSTLIRILMGLITADSGEIEVLGHTIPQAQALAKEQIGYASEDMRLYKNKSLAWHMKFISKIYPKQWDEKYAVELLRNFDLIPEQKIKGMSHGQRVKASLLLVLARHPQLLILDEPTTGLDPVARKEVLNEMMKVVADESRSVLFSSHNTQDVEQLSDQICFIDRGELVDCDNRETFLESWRRVRVRLDHGRTLDDQGIKLNKHIKEIIQRGHTADLIVKDFDANILSQIEIEGVAMQQVEHMSLEEIFVAEVEAKRADSLIGVKS